MKRPFLDASRRHPITLPDGSEHPLVVHLSCVLDHPNIAVGAHSYYNGFEPVQDYAQKLAPYLYPGAPERLEIGRFVQIAHGAQFITASANHPMDGLSTYPFLIFRPETMGDYAGQVSDPDHTRVGHDVWIGHEAVVLPGVTIGHGSIIGARAVVSQDVPPYHIVAGNPARQVRPRFDAPTIDRLLKIAWWDWEIDRIEQSLKAIRSGDLEALEAG